MRFYPEFKNVDDLFKYYINEILTNGLYSEGARPHYKSDGTEANSIYITDVAMKFDLSLGEFPISTLRPIAIKGAIKEILWIWQQASNDLNQLRSAGVFWWDDWALEDGCTIGQRYGATVRRHSILTQTIEKLKNNPFNRRSIMNLWQYQDLNEKGALDPCVYAVCFDVRKINDEFYLDMKLNQRSSDFLVAGLGINQMQYVALQMMIANHLGWKVGTFSWNVMNLHIYDRFIPQAKELLNRPSSNEKVDFYLNKPNQTKIEDFMAEDFVLTNYKPTKPQLKFDLAI